MVTVYHETNPLAIPDDLARAAGLQEGARVELTATAEGLLLRSALADGEENLALLTARAFAEANRALWDNPEEDAAWADWQ